MIVQRRVMLAMCVAALAAATTSPHAAHAAATTVAGGMAPTSQAVTPTGYPGSFTNVLNATFGASRPDATVRDKTELDRIAYYRYIYGDATTTGNGTDGLYNNYRSRHRDYPQGDPRSLHVFTPDALVLKAHCGLDTGIRTDCADGNIESGIMRFALPIRPGSFIEIRCGMPPAPYAWPAFWLNPGEEDPPDHPGGKPHVSVLDWPPEIDIFDEFGFNGVKPGHYLTSGTPTNGHDAQFGNPHDTYRAPDYGDKWYYQPAQDLTVGLHTYGLNWGSDNILSFMLDGRVYKRTYLEWNSKDNIPAHLIASLQIGPKFNDMSHISDQGGIPNGWDWRIDYIRVWKDAK